MPAPAVTIRVKAGHRLMERIQEASRRLDVSPGNFIEFAIENELSRQESELAHENQTLSALQQRLLNEGQLVTIHKDEMVEEHEEVCALCLRPVTGESGVEGPLLCDSCHALAKGAGAAP